MKGTWGGFNLAIADEYYGRGSTVFAKLRPPLLADEPEIDPEELKGLDAQEQQDLEIARFNGRVAKAEASTTPEQLKTAFSTEYSPGGPTQDEELMDGRCSSVTLIASGGGGDSTDTAPVTAAPTPAS